MINIEIPYIVENNRIDRASAKNEIQILTISDKAKSDVYEAIYHRRPNVVSFEDAELKEVLLLQNALRKLGAPYRRLEE